MKIVIPLDGSSDAESALGPGVALARRWQAELILIRVTAPLLTAAPELYPSLGHEFTQQARDAAEVYLKEVQARYPDLTSHLFGPIGSPKERIEAVAREAESDLIVMASHGRTGLARWLLGSTAEYVLRHSHCPVLLLRPDFDLSPGHEFGHVLVPVDGSEGAKQVVSQVAPYLKAGAQVTVLRASGLTARDYTMLNSPDEVTNYLAHLAEQLRHIDAAGFQTEHVVVDGVAADSIVAYAHKHQCDLIAMATHGRTGFRRFVLGSVTERVSRHAECPVLAFPQGPDQ